MKSIGSENSDSSQVLVGRGEHYWVKPARLFFSFAILTIISPGIQQQDHSVSRGVNRTTRSPKPLLR